MNTELRKKAKNDFEKDCFKLMNNSIFGKTMENAQKCRDIKLVTTEKRRNYLVLEPNYHRTKFLKENALAKEMRKTLIFMIKLVYLSLSILELSKIVMFKFWHDYVKLKYEKKEKLCYMDTDSFIVYIKTYICKDISEDFETRFDTSNYELDRQLLKGKNKKRK